MFLLQKYGHYTRKVQCFLSVIVMRVMTLCSCCYFRICWSWLPRSTETGYSCR